MSVDTPDDTDSIADELGIEVNDEEGLVDKRTKQHILNLRIEVDNDERELFVNKPTDPDNPIQYQQAVQYWAVSVKQYLRAIKRLWHDESDKNDIRNVDYYWREKQIGEYTLVPPDKNGYEFSLIQQPNVDADQIRRMYHLPSDEDVPRPRTVNITGLNGVLERDQIGHTWTVYTDKAGAPPNWEHLTLHQQSPLPKDLLETAVEVADDFLQQAGIGFKIGNDLPDWGYEQLKNAIDNDDIDVV